MNSITWKNIEEEIFKLLKTIEKCITNKNELTIPEFIEKSNLTLDQNIKQAESIYDKVREKYEINEIEIIKLKRLMELHDTFEMMLCDSYKERNEMIQYSNRLVNTIRNMCNKKLGEKDDVCVKEICKTQKEIEEEIISSHIIKINKEKEMKKYSYWITKKGNCGSDLNYIIYSNGGMLIEGSGSMNDYKHDEDVPYKGQKKDIKEIIIKDGTTRIGNWCFRNFNSLTYISIPTTVTSLGNGCFCNCSKLPEIIIPSYVTKLSFGCLQCCSSLTSITIPSTLKNIEDYCFGSCSNLRNIEIERGNEKYEIENDILKTKDGQLVFYMGCYQMKEINIPTSIKSISNYCFEYCSKLSTINIPLSVSSIGKECFSFCSNLSRIDIPPSVSEIEEGCFQSCKNLSTINIPTSVKYFGKNCFKECSNLSTLYIPDNVSVMGRGCFSGCENLKGNIRIDPDNPTFRTDGTRIFEKGFFEGECLVW